VQEEAQSGVDKVGATHISKLKRLGNRLRDGVGSGKERVDACHPRGHADCGVRRVVSRDTQALFFTRPGGKLFSGQALQTVVANRMAARFQVLGEDGGSKVSGLSAL